jgi:hypothetical protein
LEKHVVGRVTRLGEFRPIGRLFTLGSFCETYRNSTNTWATFLHCKICALIFAINGLGDFFTSASGHPGRPATCYVIADQLESRKKRLKKTVTFRRFFKTNKEAFQNG